MVVVLVTFSVSIARVVFPVLFPLVGNAPISAPVVVGVSLFASFFAVSLESSARLHCEDCREAYKAHLATARRFE